MCFGSCPGIFLSADPGNRTEFLLPVLASWGSGGLASAEGLVAAPYLGGKQKDELAVEARGELSAGMGYGELGPRQGGPPGPRTVIIVIILRLGLSSLITSYKLRLPLLLHSGLSFQRRIFFGDG